MFTVVVSLSFGADIILPLLRGAIGFLLCFVLPGYLFMSLRKPSTTSSLAQGLLIGMLMSIGLTILGGVVLAVLGILITMSGWILYWSGLAAIPVTVIVLRQLRRLFAGRLQPKQGKPAGYFLVFTQSDAILVLLLILIIGAAIFINALGVSLQPQPRFTMLWLVPTESHDFADEAQSSWTWRIGVRNMEASSESYQLDLVLEDKVAQSFTIGPLGISEVWEQSVIPPPSVLQVVELRLYKITSPDQIYRYLRVRLT